jgi:hypothetical protein
MKGKEKMEIWEKCYQKNPNIVFRKIANEVILVPIRHNVGDLESIYTLNEVAARIWELIDGKRNMGQIRDRILQEFEATSQRIERDLSKYIGELEDIGAINIK